MAGLACRAFSIRRSNEICNSGVLATGLPFDTGQTRPSSVTFRLSLYLMRLVSSFAESLNLHTPPTHSEHDRVGLFRFCFGLKLWCPSTMRDVPALADEVVYLGYGRSPAGPRSGEIVPVCVSSIYTEIDPGIRRPGNNQHTHTGWVGMREDHRQMTKV